MARNASHLLTIILMIFLIASPAHAETNRTGASNSNTRATPIANHIDGLSLSSNVAAMNGTVRVTVTGTGNCLTRIDNGGVQIVRGSQYADIPDGFPKFISLTIQGAPGSYTIQAQNANPRGTSCTGTASATLIVTGGVPVTRTAAPVQAEPSNHAIPPPPATPATPVTSATPAPTPAPIPATTPAPAPTLVAPFTTVNNAVVDPCNLSAREQAQRGVTCAVQADQTPAVNAELPARTIPFPAVARAMPASSPMHMLAPAGVAQIVPAKRQKNAYEPGQLVILWDDLSDGINGLQILARDYKVQPIQRIELNNLGGLLATFQLRDNKLAILLRDLLRQQYPGWHVDLHAQYQSLAGPRIYLQTKIGAPATTPLLPNLRIGILDTAVTPIPALQASKLTQRSFLENADMPASTVHGTAIAALISGQDSANNFRALAVGTQLFVGAIMRDQMGESRSNTATLLHGLDWLIGNRVHVVNLSLGGPGDDLMASVFAKLRSKGIIVVASAGNGGPDAPPSYPAAYRGVLAVTAVDALDQSYRDANSGPYIAIAAPGVDVWTPDAENGHYVSGTSFSAAVVTGAIGLMLSHRADLTTERVRANLCRHARDLGAPGFDPVYGCGLMQIGRTLTTLE